MITVCKYEISTIGKVDVDMPIDAWILSVAVLGEKPAEKPVIYALVNTDSARTEPRRLVIVGTGKRMPPLEEDDVLQFIGTFALYDGRLVGHVFERRRRVMERPALESAEETPEPMALEHAVMEQQ